MNKKYITKSFQETQRLGQNLARQILSGKSQKFGVVLALSGDLGAGKTTFLQGFAKGLGVKEKILSPTFILMKKFKILKTCVPQNGRPSILRHKWFYHFDCYRLESPEPTSAKDYGVAKEILDLGFKEIILNPQNIVAIEWPEKISQVLPKDIISIIFNHKEKTMRELTIKE
ncbi:MAG: hypothetical protein A3C58_02115 [Candidatus Staskawiczbacteria bacterium RIFCSPHIGHO2_02_FULL_34_10]|uniref:tRNA threonylcarbamoyladenosine biosynthesis protein TsaE n=1 Tax=Candidatus Staskawiczbacteria bacterium RIFCSPHIGHO2_02_FULL_34_10 TaxID=1802205 RepID=A0A1G2HYF9_9BACT|nr:MAG: hypothetical protein A3C58_02115 [Candidatus Staskawiczbacteria bacterium RIFCSPHIGHO2_02_FULL_34_10]